MQPSLFELQERMAQTEIEVIGRLDSDVFADLKNCLANSSMVVLIPSEQSKLGAFVFLVRERFRHRGVSYQQYLHWLYLQ